jgi:hypothetical protein
MATFVEKYVRRPIAALDEHSLELLDLYAAAERDHSVFRLRLGSGSGAHEWTIRRAENAALADEAEPDEQ